MTVHLPQVTLCAIDCLNPELALRALELSLRACRFADAMLLTDAKSAAHLNVPAGVRLVEIEKLSSRDAYSDFMLRGLHAHVTSPRVLVVQWDGYVLNPGAWQESFLEFDYIGAPWPWHRDGHDVGNGGFSLRSRRLLRLMAGAEFAPLQGINEDDVICRVYRPHLESRGMRFAPAHVAACFAYERSLPDAPTFGFHGAFNLWRHLDDGELIRLIARLAKGGAISDELAQLLWATWDLRRFDCMRALFAHLRASACGIHGGVHSDFSGNNAWLVDRLVSAGMPRESAERCLALCERLDREAPGARASSR